MWLWMATSSNCKNCSWVSHRLEEVNMSHSAVPQGSRKPKTSSPSSSSATSPFFKVSWKGREPCLADYSTVSPHVAPSHYLQPQCPSFDSSVQTWHAGFFFLPMRWKQVQCYSLPSGSEAIFHLWEAHCRKQIQCSSGLGQEHSHASNLFATVWCDWFIRTLCKTISFVGKLCSLYVPSLLITFKITQANRLSGCLAKRFTVVTQRSGLSTVARITCIANIINVIF